MAAAIKRDPQATVGRHFDHPAGLHELAGQLFRFWKEEPEDVQDVESVESQRTQESGDLEVEGGIPQSGLAQQLLKTPLNSEFLTHGVSPRGGHLTTVDIARVLFHN